MVGAAPVHEAGLAKGAQPSIGAEILPRRYKNRLAEKAAALIRN